MNITIYHNPRCGSSRNTLGLIRNTGVEPSVIDYLANPPSHAQLAAMIAQAGLTVRGAIRAREAPYAELGLDNPALTDAALRIVGAITCAQLRTSDLLARMGGDQFQVVATDTDARAALTMAEKIRAAIAAAAFPGCDRLTVSIAVAQAVGEESADALMLRVNAALARAKRAGRNCVELAMQ